MATNVSELYSKAHIEDYLDQHLDMETALVRHEIAEAHILKKLVHHFKLSLSQVGKIIDNIPETIAMPDSTVVTLIDKTDLDDLKTMLKELGKFELPEVTPELERDIFIYAFTHNYVNAWIMHNPLFAKRLVGALRKATIDDGLTMARIMVNFYWEYEAGDLVTDVIGEPGHRWNFIDPNGEVPKIMEADNLTAVQARARLMQRSIDGMYETDIMESMRPEERTWVDIFYYVIDGRNLPLYKPFHEGLRMYDPSRYASEDTSEG